MDKSWLADDCFYVDKRQQASRLLGYLRGDRNDIPIIEDNGRPYAIVDPRSAMRRGLRHEIGVEKMAWPVGVIRDGDNETTILQRFASSGAWALPATIGRPPRKAGYLAADTFLRNAYTSGPIASVAAQGLPPLWTDSTIEDAIQAFAASALPYLPVINEGVEGIVRREALMPYLEQDPSGMGRKDVAGDRSTFRDEPIDAIIEAQTPTIAGDAEFPAILDALAKQPCWFIEPDGIEAVTAVSMLQTIAMTSGIGDNVVAHFRQERA